MHNLSFSFLSVTLFFTMNFLRWMNFISGHSFFTSHIYISIKILYMWVITVPLCRLFIFADFTLRVCLASQSIQIRKIAHVLWTEYLIESSSANSFCVFVPVNCRILWIHYLNLNTLLKKKIQSIKNTNKLSSFSLGWKKWVNSYLC